VTANVTGSHISMRLAFGCELKYVYVKWAGCQGFSAV